MARKKAQSGPGHLDRANALDRVGNRLAPEVSAAVEIMVEPVFGW